MENANLSPRYLRAWPLELFPFGLQHSSLLQCTLPTFFSHMAQRQEGFLFPSFPVCKGQRQSWVPSHPMTTASAESLGCSLMLLSLQPLCSARCGPSQKRVTAIAFPCPTQAKFALTDTVSISASLSCMAELSKTEAPRKTPYELYCPSLYFICGATYIPSSNHREGPNTLSASALESTLCFSSLTAHECQICSLSSWGWRVSVRCFGRIRNHRARIEYRPN